MSSPSTDYIAFEGERRIAAGDLQAVARAAKQTLDQRKDASVLIFNGSTSEPVDLDFRGGLADVLARLPAPNGTAPAEPELPPNRGPGRPKLGVVAREVTLLPRHWEWLAQQAGRGSAARRRRQGSDPPGAGSGLSLHVGDGRQQAAFRGGDPRAVCAGPGSFQGIDRRLAGGCPRSCRKACGTGVSPATAGDLIPKR
jgi:hypothetical protein